MIEERASQGGTESLYSFSTYFFSKILRKGQVSCRRWTRDVDIFAMELVLIPVHWGDHWCLAVVKMSDKRISYYDSLGGSDKGCLRIIAAYLKDEHVDKKGVSIWR